MTPEQYEASIQDAVIHIEAHAVALCTMPDGRLDTFKLALAFAQIVGEKAALLPQSGADVLAKNFLQRFAQTTTIARKMAAEK